MSRLDDELRNALRREEPSPDFTDRLMARIASLPNDQKVDLKQEKELQQIDWRAGWRERLIGFFGTLAPGQLKWATAAGLACLLLFAVAGIHRYRENQRVLVEMAEGEKAKEQVMFAMKVASAKLNVAQKKVQAVGVRENDVKQ